MRSTLNASAVPFLLALLSFGPLCGSDTDAALHQRLIAPHVGALVAPLRKGSGACGHPLAQYCTLSRMSRGLFDAWKAHASTGIHSGFGQGAIKGKAFVLTSDCTQWFSGQGYDSNCQAASAAMQACRTGLEAHGNWNNFSQRPSAYNYCGLFHIIPPSCVSMPFDAHRAYAPFRSVAAAPPPQPAARAPVAASKCLATVYSDGSFRPGFPKATYGEGQWRLGEGVAGRVSAIQVTGKACVARLWEYANFTGWSASFAAGVYPVLDFVQFASNNAAEALQLGRLVAPAEARCRPGWYSIAAEPCGPLQVNQGLGVIAFIDAIFEFASRAIGATFLHNPDTMCSTRRAMGYVGERLFRITAAQVASGCRPEDLVGLAKEGVYTAIHADLAHPMTGGGDHFWHRPDPGHWAEFLTNGRASLVFRNWLTAAGLDPQAPPANALFVFHGCPREVFNPSLLLPPGAGDFLREAAARSFREQARPSRWGGARADVARLAVHFRWGDVGRICGGHRPTSPRSVCKGTSYFSVARYNSNIDAIVAVLTAARAAAGLTEGTSRVALFSTGNVTDAPFARFRAAFPAAALHVHAEDLDRLADSATPDAFVADVAAMAEADILITSCGTFSHLVGVLTRGVAFAADCLDNSTLWARPPVRYDLETGRFDEAQFKARWADYRRGAAGPPLLPPV